MDPAIDIDQIPPTRECNIQNGLTGQGHGWQSLHNGVHSASSVEKDIQWIDRTIAICSQHSLEKCKKRAEKLKRQLAELLPEAGMECQKRQKHETGGLE